MELQSRRNNSGESEALEPIELPLLKGHQSAYPFAEEESPLLHYWRILRKRRWAVIATAAIVFALSIIVTLRATRLYQATSKIAVFPETPNVLGLKGVEDSAADYQYDVALETQSAILRSDALAMKVIDAMHLDQNRAFVGATGSKTEGSIRVSSMQPDPAKTAGLLGAFHGGLSVQIIPNSRLLQISYTHPDPRLAAEIDNALVKTYIEENFKTKYDAVTQTSAWLSTELADLQLKVEASEEKLVRYQRERGILGVDEKQNIVTAKLDELNKELGAAQMDRIQKDATYRFATAEDLAAFAKTDRGGKSTLLEKLREKEAELNTQYAEATTRFGSGYTKVVELSNQLKQVRADILAEENSSREGLRDQYLAALEREKLLTEAFEEQKQEANKLNESAIEYSTLKRDAETNRQLYQDLLQRLK